MKKLSVFLVVAFIFLFSVGQSSATLITGLVKTGGDTDTDYVPQVVENGLIAGALSYVDRPKPGLNATARWGTIPTPLVGIDYVMTENDDKNTGVNGENYAVTLASAGYLHVFVDQRLGTAGVPLSWLTDNSADAVFTKTYEIVQQVWTGSIVGAYAFDVWTALVEAGTYNLGEQTGASMYGIAASPVPEPATMLLVGFGLMGLAGFGRKKLFNK